MALELEEAENFKTWIIAGQDPKKFRWTTRRRKTSQEIGEKIIRFAREKMRASPVKGDVWDYAKAKGIEAVFRVERDGKVVYVNSDGIEVKKPQGVFFVASGHNQAVSLAEEVAKKLDGR